MYCKLDVSVADDGSLRPSCPLLEMPRHWLSSEGKSAARFRPIDERRLRAELHGTMSVRETCCTSGFKLLCGGTAVSQPPRTIGRLDADMRRSGMRNDGHASPKTLSTAREVSSRSGSIPLDGKYMQGRSQPPLVLRKSGQLGLLVSSCPSS